METLSELIARFPRPGRLTWIGLRPERRGPLRIVTRAELRLEGLVGDHRTRPGARAVTLIQAEHLAVIAALAGKPEVPPEVLRRNLVISGVNLHAARGRRLRIGDVTLEIAGPCAPCSRMEQALGPGGYNAMRGHGGVTARVLRPGWLTAGMPVSVVPAD
ncbi:MOSC domain-containing protein [Oceanibium sediminis]|uniref:MOSC domain-containing protein n=1 Tax=Oceanibium sediminis TaxID=2026339 RepID=UPI000DD4B827|nr:MOSC domain-containing protein [Oceanibium sediminis]